MEFKTEKSLGKDALKAWARIEALCQAAARVEWRKPLLLVGQQTSLQVLRTVFADPAEHGWSELYGYGQVGDKVRPVAPDFLEHLEDFEVGEDLQALVAKFGPPICVSYGAYLGDWIELLGGVSLFLGFTADSPDALLPAFAKWNTGVLAESRQPRAELSFGFGADFGPRGFVSGRSVRISRASSKAELRVRTGEQVSWLYEHCASTLGKLNAKDGQWVGSGAIVPSFKAPKTSLPQAKVLPKLTLSRLIWNGKRSIPPSEAPKLLSSFGQSMFGTPTIETRLQVYETIPQTMVEPLRARCWQTPIYGERTVPSVPIHDPAAFCTAHGHSPAAHTQAVWDALGPPTGVSWLAQGRRNPKVLVIWSWQLAPDLDLQDALTYLVSQGKHDGGSYDRTRLRVRLQGHIGQSTVLSRVQAHIKLEHTTIQAKLAHTSPSLDGALLATLRAIHKASGVWLSGSTRNWEVDWQDPLGFWNSEKSPHADRVGGKKKPTTYFEVDFHNYRLAEPKKPVRSGPVSDLEQAD